MKIEITGIDELRKKLGQVAANEALKRGMQKAVYQVQNRMADYPGPKPGSTYIRQGTLGRRWTTSVTVGGDTVTGKVGNNTEYGPWVQSDRFQARMHKGRWQTDKQVLREEKDRITELMQDEIDRALR